jgi:hypothetical protein
VFERAKAFHALDRAATVNGSSIDKYTLSKASRSLNTLAGIIEAV